MRKKGEKSFSPSFFFPKKSEPRFFSLHRSHFLLQSHLFRPSFLLLPFLASLVPFSLSGVFRFLSPCDCLHPLRITRAKKKPNRSEERARRKQKEREQKNCSIHDFGWFFSTSTSTTEKTEKPKKEKTRCGSFGARGCPRARPGTGAAPRAKGRS